MQMKIPHSLVVLVVSLGIFAAASPTGNIAPVGCTERIEVPVEVVKTCPQPEIISIKTVYRTVKEIVPDCGCTDDFTDFANVQLIADTACRNGLIFSPDGRTKKRGIFERSPACQSFSIVEDPSIALRKRYEGDCQDGCGSGDLTGHIHDKFDEVKNTFKHNLNQNINNNDNTDQDDSQVTGGGGDGFGGFGGFGGFKSKRQFGFGGFGGGFGGGDFDDNDNQNINQNVNANQNLMANLGKFNSFFGTGNGGAIGSGGAATAAAAGLSGLAFGINDNTDFNVNNNVAFEDDTFFKKAKRNAQFGFGGGFGDGFDGFDSNENQNINQNINNNQNLNEDFFSGVFGGGGDGFGFDGIGIVPFFPGFIGGFGGFGGFGDFGGIEDSAMNENFNFVPDTNIETFGSGGGLSKRCDSGNCVSGNTNVNYNSNTNYNNNEEAVAIPQYETIIETVPVVETIPVVETVYQPVVEYETVEIIEKVPVVEQVYEPVTVVEQVAVPVPVCATPECPQASKKTTSTVTEVFETVPQPVVEKVEVVEVAQPVVEVVEVAQPVVEVVEVAQPVVEVQKFEVVEVAKPVVEYSAVFYPVAGCGVPNRPSYTYGSCNK